MIVEVAAFGHRLQKCGERRGVAEHRVEVVGSVLFPLGRAVDRTARAKDDGAIRRLVAPAVGRRRVGGRNRIVATAQDDHYEGKTAKHGGRYIRSFGDWVRLLRDAQPVRRPRAGDRPSSQRARPVHARRRQERADGRGEKDRIRQEWRRSHDGPAGRAGGRPIRQRPGQPARPRGRRCVQGPDRRRDPALHGRGLRLLAAAGGARREGLLGTTMTGVVPGDLVVGVEHTVGGVGLLPNHLLTTGLQHIYDGITIATIAKTPSLSPLIYGSADNLVAAYYDHDGKRAILDGGFTRLYLKWDTAGTARYVKNAAAWLANAERFGDAVVAVKGSTGPALHPVSSVPAIAAAKPATPTAAPAITVPTAHDDMPSSTLCLLLIAGVLGLGLA